MRFSHLLASITDWSIPVDVALQIFYSGLDNTATLALNVAVGGLFASQTLTERKEFLDLISGRFSFLIDHDKLHREAFKSSLESRPAESNLFISQDSPVESSPEPRTPKEGEFNHWSLISNSRLILFENHRNTSNSFDAQPREELSYVHTD